MTIAEAKQLTSKCIGKRVKAVHVDNVEGVITEFRKTKEIIEITIDHSDYPVVWHGGKVFKELKCWIYLRTSNESNRFKHVEFLENTVNLPKFISNQKNQIQKCIDSTEDQDIKTILQEHLIAFDVIVNELVTK